MKTISHSAFLFESDGKLTLYVVNQFNACVWAHECGSAETALIRMNRLIRSDDPRHLSPKLDQTLVDRFNESVNLYEVQDGKVIATLNADRSICINFDQITNPDVTREMLRLLSTLPAVIIPASVLP